MQIPDHCISAIPTKLTGKCITANPCTLEVEMDEMVSIQNIQLIILLTVHMKDETGPI